ncbi:cobalt ECF transporter T component CbiQ [Romboutsia lituseburensis]|uniref:Cobalt/nickel transport system permease protein n=1 Tax=Romboutsia lituseburensis DSM 797 TaxID=1121325 RepID=A0A1G9QZL5_9FIRM|nr:cobalt ECF transporter T component CbiQ [Romboutsia lituseburensis]CEH35819.1 Cobalt transport protein CbiQ [Romboutsia lituseburensis]SDM16037.1 cobalt/nickel transport system permease protein [Romboutsia lituseburensis DSM 797]
MLLIDKYAYTNSLTEINPKIKGSIGLIFLIISMAFKNIFCLISIITFMSSLIVFLAKIDLKSYLKLVKIPMYFLIMGVLINLINISFDSKGLIYSLNIMSLNIGISNKSIITSVHILFRAIACLTCIYFFILTTPFNQIIFLLKKLHISDTVIELSMLVYRFIFIFLEEVSDIRKSQQLRFGYINLKTSYNSIGILGNMLFKRMMKRYDEMCISLDIKLYDSKFHIVGDENV